MARALSRRTVNALLGATPLLATGSPAFAQLSDAGAGLPEVPEGAERELAIEAYIYAYPLVTMEYTRRVITNAVKPEGIHAPMGQFISLRQYPTASFKDVTAPNADTLYSSAWLDLSQEPVVLHVPDEHGRYYLMPMLEAWTNVFADPGTRTTGTGPGDFAIAGPGWHGELPAGVELLRSSTNLAWIIGRTYCTGTPEDYAAVHAIQDQYSLTPLSAWGKPYTPPAGKVDPSIDMNTAPRDQVERLDTMSFFRLAAELMKSNSPYAADVALLNRLRRIGLDAGRDFDPAPLSGKTWIGDVPKLALERIDDHYSESGEELNGWSFWKPVGLYGTDYLQRAFITRYGLGANRTDDAIYPTATTDSAGRKLDGANRYVIRFPNGQMPPARGFWSLTMYDAQYFFVANPLNRYTLSQRNALKAGADGTVELYVQATNPGPDKESNWLPAPNGTFVLMMRLYWPRQNPPSILDGTWKPPPVEKA